MPIEKLKITGLGLLIGLVLTLVYWNHFDNAFHFDDMHTIVNNQYITDVGNIPKFFLDAQTSSSLPTNQAYRPVVTTLNAIDYWLAGELDPVIFHWHIYLEFLVLLVLLFFTFRALFDLAGGPTSPYPALFAVALFAFHTATAETLNYVISRSDGFSTLMVVSAFLIFIKNTGWRRQLALIPFALGCLTKPTALMLAPILAVFSLVMQPPSITISSENAGYRLALTRALRETGAYFVVGVLLYAFTRSMFSPTWTPGGNYSGIDYLVTQSYVIWVYIRTFLLPTGLTADTDLQIIRSMLDARVLWGLTVILFTLGLATWALLKRRRLPIAFGILWFYIALVPSSSIIPLAEVMNHHRTFFPYIGLVMATSWGGYMLLSHAQQRFGKRRPVAVFSFLAIIVLVAHGIGTYHRNEVWHSPETLWRDVSIKSPANGRGLMNYGLTFMRRGDLEQAIEYFEAASETAYRNHPYLQINLGIAKNALGRNTQRPALQKEAREHLVRAIELGPNFPQTHYRYANWLFQNGQSESALIHAARAVELSPANKSARDLLNQISDSIGPNTNASQAREIARPPEYWLNQSLAYYHSGNFDLSIEAARALLQIKPDSAPAFNNICAALNKLGKYSEAVDACLSALAIDPQFARANANLDWAHRKLAESEN